METAEINACTIFMERCWTVKIVTIFFKAYLVTILEELLMIYLGKVDNWELLQRKVQPLD